MVASVPARVDALAVRANGQGGDAERQRVRRDDGPGVRVDHRDGVVARRRGADEGTVIRHDRRKRLARDRDGVLDPKRVGVEEGNAVVAVVGDDDGRAGRDVADRATTDRDGAYRGDIRVHIRLVIHMRLSNAIRHQKVSHLRRYLRRFGVHRP